ncbi:MAG: hypothetical protein A2X94_01495 [Bdellovibrionales bacterium GWB1_55_8]|nr:MAG: hypothetical protein A2X94_01495 [Bdellovibrionales bacterium GWB1_55_8]
MIKPSQEILQIAVGLALLLCGWTPSFAAGGGGGTADGGGDFAYYHSGVRLHQQRAAQGLIFDTRETPQAFFDEVFTSYQVSRERLASILGHIEERLSERRFRKNPRGELEPLLLDFGLNENGEEAIFILSGFYDWGVRQLEQSNRGFEKLQAEENLEKAMRIKLFKEALHHFGIINDDLAQNYARYSDQLGLRAARQIRDCHSLEQRYAGFDCMKSWDPEYWNSTKLIENWESGKLAPEAVILGSANGIMLEFDLSRKKEIEVREPKFKIHGTGKCVERTYERSDCTIKKEMKDGKRLTLSRAFRISLKYEKENDFEIPLQSRAPVQVTYSIGGDRDDDSDVFKESKVILRRKSK